MARKSLMTWVAASRRWTKKYQGKMYAVSCRQLGTAGTKEASREAANRWWENKQREIEDAPPTEEDRRINSLKVWSMVQDWSSLDEESRERLVNGMLGEGQYQKLREQAGSLVSSALLEAPAERTVGAQVEDWKALLRGVCQSGQMSEGRFDAYCRNVKHFVQWMGPESPIDSIDASRVEGFFTYLSGKVAGETYSPTYAHSLMMTAKQFISRLAELGLIPVPGNLRSRRFRFNHSAPARIEVFSVEELRELLSGCDGFSERTKLYLLLMLNVGAYQNDLAELRQEEIDWKTGILTRSRSKTKERNGPVVSYQLWPETFELLKKHRAREGDLALTTSEGNPLVRYWLETPEGKTEPVMRRYDVVQGAWSRLAKKLELKKIRLGMKHLRKTGATLLGEHPQYKFFANHYLADSPRSVADRHYVIPSNAEFYEALQWLREQILGAAPEQVLTE